MFRPNRTLSKALLQAASIKEVEFEDKLRILLALYLPRNRRDLERAITSYAFEAGFVAESSTNFDGVYVGDWSDLLQLFLDNWEEILELIIAIISLF